MIVCPWKDIKKYASLLPGIDEAFDAVNALTEYEDKKNYPLSNGNRFFIAVQSTKAPDLAEAHRNYLDIQYIVKGRETMGWAPVDTLTLSGEFNEQKDKGMYSGHCDFMDIAEGYCYVVYPEDAHMPGRHLDVPNDFVKVVVKLKVN